MKVSVGEQSVLVRYVFSNPVKINHEIVELEVGIDNVCYDKIVVTLRFVVEKSNVLLSPLMYELPFDVVDNGLYECFRFQQHFGILAETFQDNLLALNRISNVLESIFIDSVVNKSFSIANGV